MKCSEVQQEFAVAALTKSAPLPEIVGHARVCPDCAAERARLETTAGLLANVSAEDVRQSEASVDDLFLQRLVGAATAENRGRRRRAIAASIGGAAAAVAIGVASVVGISAQQDGPPTGVTQASATENGVHATAKIQPVSTGGSNVHVALSGVSPGTHCVLRATTKDSGLEVVAVWNAEYDGTASVDGAVRSSPQDISNIEVAKVDGPTLVTIPVNT